MTDDEKTIETLDEARTQAGSGRRKHSPWRFQPGESFGRYTILQRLGAGGMGVVYSAYDPELAWNPAEVRKRWLWTGAVVLLLGISAWSWLYNRSARLALCRAGGDRLEEIWNPARRDALVQSFVSTGLPFARQSAEEAGHHFDALGREWVETYTRLCEATRKRGEQSEELLDRQMLCLNQRLREIDQSMELLSRGEEDLVEHALESIEGLPPISRCAQSAELLSLQAQPTGPATVKKIEDLQVKRARAEALSAAGRYEEALKEVNVVIEGMKDIDYAPLVADSLCLRGSMEDQLGHPDNASKTLRRALVAAEKGGDENTVIRVLNELTWVNGVSLKEIKEAEFYSDLEKARIGRIGTPEKARLSWLAMRAAVEQTAGHYTKALEYQKESTAGVIRRKGNHQLETATAENQLGNMYLSMNSYEEALSHYRKSLQIRESILGPLHPDVATSLTNIGSALGYLERYEESLQELERALKIEEKTYGPEGPNLATTLNNIAYGQEGSGQLEDALATHNRAIKIIRRAWGPGNPQTAYAYLNRCSVYRKLERLGRALDDAREAKKILVSVYGAGHPLYAFALNAEGVMLLAMGRPGEAIAPLQQAVDIRSDAESDHLAAAETRFSLARALYASGFNPKKARKLAIESRKIFVDAEDLGREDREAVDAWLDKLK